MWETIKNFIFEKKSVTITLARNPFFLDEYKEELSLHELSKGSKVIENALAHYCRYCDTGFKTRGVTKNHIRLKHPEHYVSPITYTQLPQAG